MTILLNAVGLVIGALLYTYAAGGTRALLESLAIDSGIEYDRSPIILGWLWPVVLPAVVATFVAIIVACGVAEIYRRAYEHYREALG